MHELKPCLYPDGYPGDLSRRLKWWATNCDRTNTDCQIKDMFRMAADEIGRRAQPDNAPLTLEELRGMDGEPVWWWNKTAKPICTICIYNKFSGRLSFANFDWQKDETFAMTKYEWLKKCGYKPYRRKPEPEGGGG